MSYCEAERLRSATIRRYQRQPSADKYLTLIGRTRRGNRLDALAAQGSAVRRGGTVLLDGQSLLVYGTGCAQNGADGVMNRTELTTC